MQHVLRAISGPQAGAVYVLSSRTTIGRASDCEIQILHEGVSRHHAKLTPEEDGTITIADLSSDNGTFIEEQRIERHVLAAGEVIRIMRSRFTYEVLQTDDAVTSAAFRRKVTSGDSLRQTIVHEKTLSTIRAGVAQGLPGGVTAERARPYSRPQAAAPALSGARPGAAASGRFDVDVPPAAALEPEPTLEPPTPPHGEDSSAFVRERWPDRLARGATPPHEIRPAPASHASRRPGRSSTAVPRSGERRPGADTSEAGPAHPSASGTGSYGWHVEAGHGRRERITVVPTTVAQPLAASAAAVTGTAARVERMPSPLPPSGPSGRMSSLEPSGPELGPDPTAAAGAMPSASVPTPSQGGGWIRVSRTLDTPGSMRPGSTLSGVPRIDPDGEDVVRPPASPSLPPMSARKSITAEYGMVGERDEDASDAPVPREDAATNALPAAIPAARAPAAAASARARADDPDAELDAMKTVPSVRRAVVFHGSTTPTEEVPRILDVPAKARAVDDDDDPYETRPRVTVSPRDPSVHTVTPAASDGPAAPVAPAPSSRVPTIPGARAGIRGARAGARAIAYEDTLRFQRAEPPDLEHKRREGLERLVDILEYRELRLRALRGGSGDASAAQRYAALEQVLQQRPPAGDDMAALRRYHRFVCSIPAQLTHHPRGAASTASVEIEDLSAGGAKVTFGEYSITTGETVWLAVELAQADRSRIPHPDAELVMIQARVVWAEPHEAKLGLVFAGAPRYDVEATEPLG